MQGLVNGWGKRISEKEIILEIIFSDRYILKSIFQFFLVGKEIP